LTTLNRQAAAQVADDLVPFHGDGFLGIDVDTDRLPRWTVLLRMVISLLLPDPSTADLT
jgi:hypothetical protein